MNNTNQSKNETNKETIKSVFKETRESKFGFSEQLFWFVFLTILSLCLAYLWIYSLICTLPFVIVPSLFAFMSVNAIKGTKNSEGVTFFRMYKAYFTQLFFGGYRVFIGFLKGLAVYAGTGTIAMTIFLNTKPEYRELFEKALNAEDLNAVNSELMSLLTNPELEKTLYLITSITLLLAVIVFLNHIFKHSVKMRRNLFSKSPIPMRQFAMVDRKVRRDNRKFILGTYFSCAWFLQLLMLLACGGGIVFSFFFLKDFNAYKAVVISLFLMFVVAIPFFNYISTLEDIIFVNLLAKYEETFVTMTLEFLTKFKDKIGIQEEEAKKIQEMLESQKKAMEESKKEDNKKDEK